MAILKAQWNIKFIMGTNQNESMERFISKSMAMAHTFLSIQKTQQNGKDTDNPENSTTIH